MIDDDGISRKLPLSFTLSMSPPLTGTAVAESRCALDIFGQIDKSILCDRFSVISCPVVPSRMFERLLL